MKPLIALLMLLFAALGIMGCDLRARPAGDANEERINWERKKDCAAQAAREFQAEGYKLNDDNIDNMASFTNHYDPALRVCFVLIESASSTTSGRSFSKVLLDAYEGKEYGSYLWFPDPVKKYWEVPPFECHVLTAVGEKRVCKSDDEFNALVNAYMDGSAAKKN